MTDSITVEAFAKVNLGLVVRSRGSDGFHPLVSLAQSVSWADRLLIETADEDSFTASGMEADEHNLAWRAVVAARGRASDPLRVHLDKHIAVSAGLGGGSADAAAALAGTGGLFGLGSDRVQELGRELGSDVPFCLEGGLAMIEGRGERVTAQPLESAYALGIVVPPFELLAAEVYARWDELGEPEGTPVPEEALPPGLRGYAPLRNDLQPAAESVAADVAAWRDELAVRWGRPVAMTGSGPALFAFFLDRDEAEAALGGRPAGARAAVAAVPVPQGWREVPGTLADPE